MKIYLLDRNPEMTNAWHEYFRSTGVIIINQDFGDFIKEHPDMEAIVSPANSFGLMDGGYDKAIIDYYGPQLMEHVQFAIINKWYGEQPVGTSMSVPISNRFYTKVYKGNFEQFNPILIHTPTMRTPEAIEDPRIIYQCMRTCLIEAKAQEVESIVIPAFGGCTGKVDPDTIAKLMFLAFNQISNQPDKLTWGYAYQIKKSLAEAMHEST